MISARFGKLDFFLINQNITRRVNGSFFSQVYILRDFCNLANVYYLLYSHSTLERAWLFDAFLV